MSSSFPAGEAWCRDGARGLILIRVMQSANISSSAAKTRVRHGAKCVIKVMQNDPVGPRYFQSCLFKNGSGSIENPLFGGNTILEI